jgi:hypothetical protein
MSLTSILLNNKEVRDKLKVEFPKPEFNLISKIKVEPKSVNYSLVGSAFDYLMRFYLEYHNKEKLLIKRNCWVAENAKIALIEKLSKFGYNSIRVGSNRNKLVNANELLQIIKDAWSEAQDNYNKFILSGKITNKLIVSCLFLGKLDSYSRRRVIDENFETYEKEDVKDLKALISIIDLKKIIVKENIYFNPNFGYATDLVRGADADLIIDDTLIDIKVTKELKLEKKYFDQIIGYYCLSLIGGINENPNLNVINNLGIYFARHGVLWTIPINKIGNQESFLRFTEWFVKYVTKGKTYQEFKSIFDSNKICDF